MLPAILFVDDLAGTLFPEDHSFSVDNLAVWSSTSAAKAAQKMSKKPWTRLKNGP